MKLRNLMVGVLTCAALASCSNDELIDNNMNQPQEEELANVPAYITVSLSTANSSSRATVNGDKDGDAEDSTHGNEGTKQENNFEQVAVIIKSLNADGENAANSGAAAVIDGKKFKELTAGDEKIYTIEENFKVLAGTHKVLTIVNPKGEIAKKVEEANAAENKYQAIGKLYDDLTQADKKITVGAKLSDYEWNYDDLLASKESVNSIMFVNRDEVTVEAKSVNGEANPVIATVTLERPVAKMMYRGMIGEDEEPTSTYPITITVTKQAFKIVYRADDAEKETPFVLVKDAADRTLAAKATITETITVNGEEKVVDLDLVAVDGVFQCYDYNKTNSTIGETPLNPIKLGTKPEDLPGVPENFYYLLQDDAGNWEAPMCEVTPFEETLKNEDGETAWSVKLTDYALVNLTNDSYVFRHIANSLGTEINTFGLLNGNNYIADPYFGEKSIAATKYGFANYAKWNDAAKEEWNGAATKWFANTLWDVAAETAAEEAPAESFFHSLPVDGTGKNPTHNGKDVGAFLQYSFENSVMSDNQLHGLTTGIVFKGKVVGTLPTMYQYGTKVYADLKDIFNAFSSGNKEIQAIEDAVEKDADYATTPEGEKAIRKAGIKIYANNECYYYTNQIKHFDNGDNNVAGNMEFAIVRNNIYSLAVTSIKGIGDAAIDPNPGIENETTVGYIQVQAKIIPWIVRFNNIEF